MREYFEISLHRPLTGVQLVFKDESERTLVERAKKEPEAFGLLFDKYYDDIFRYIIHRVGDNDIACDITSSTFHKSLEKLWTFKWMNLPFSAWLYRIATNEVNAYYRGRKKYHHNELNENELSNTDTSSSVEKELTAQPLFEQLRIAISKLDTKYQDVIVLKYFEEKSIKEISEISRKAEGTVKSLIHRGLKLLENEIDEELYKEFKNE